MQSPLRESVLSQRQWLTPTSLIALSLIPAAAGVARIVDLSSNATVTPDNARFIAMPLPVIVHIPSALIFSLLGATQFAPSLRGRSWHRRAGRLVVPAGLASALSGLWMAVFYDLPASDNGLLKVFRLLAGFGMATALVLGHRSILRRKIQAHQAWMMRSYALGLGAGTQVLTLLTWFVFFGDPSTNQRALVMGAGWAINLAVAEWFIHQLSPHKPSA
jgi:uncharacterized membrane protein YozB (DUF420 family)